MTTPQALSPCAAPDPIAEGATLLAEIIRAYSQEAALAGKTELQEAFALAWPQRTTRSAGAAEPAPEEQEQEELQNPGNRGDEDNSPIAISRRELFASLFGAKTASAAEREAPAVSPQAPSEATPAATPAAISEGAADDPPPDFAAVLTAALAANTDLAEVSRNGEPAYHSLPLLSGTYAAILADQNDPVKQLAEMVRRSSRDYPRPVPVDMFEYPPFNFSADQLQDLLNTLGTVALWQDIRFVESSAGTVYLYSTQYLDHDYAVFLAERQDVGLTLNP